MSEIEWVETVCFSDKGASRDNNEDNAYFSSVDIINHKSEDSYFASYSEKVKSDTILAVVFDGMGGGVSGETASLESAKCMDSLLESLIAEETLTAESFRTILLDTKKQMEKNILETIGGIKRGSVGCTWCGFFLTGGHIWTFWTGDSRMYRLRDGHLQLLTKDHSVAQEKIDNGSVTEEEAKTLTSWHCITAYVGDGSEIIGIAEPFDVRLNDRILLCTDGVSDMYTKDELCGYLAGKLYDSAEAMREDAAARCDDNATAIMIEFSGKREVKKIFTCLVESAKEYFDSISMLIKKMGSKMKK